MNTLDATAVPTAKRKRARAILPADFLDPQAQDKLDDVTVVACVLDAGTSTIWRWVAEGRIKPPVKVGPRKSRWSRRYVRQLAAEGLSPIAA